MADFVPKNSKDIGDANAANKAEEYKSFTPIQQTIKSQSISDKDSDKAEFRNMQAKELESTQPAETGSLKNIQVPADSSDNSEKDTNSTEHSVNVNVIRDGDKITQILVECKCGEIIPLDCIY